MSKLYNIPLGHNFLETLMRGILEEFKNDPFALAQVQILLPTRRACQKIKNSFYSIQDGRAMLLPHISPLGEVGSEPNPLLYPDLPPSGDFKVIPPLVRRGLLLQLVERFQKDSLKGTVSKSLSLRLTQDLISLIDQAQIERVPLDRLHTIVPETYASHWQITLNFLKILFETWPQILEENHYIEPYAHHWQSVDQLTQFWAKSPPQFPIIAAGSTGTMPTTRLLLKSILSFEQGRVVLPAFDDTLAPEIELESSHPQFSLRRLVQDLGQDVIPWPWCAPLEKQSSARAYLFQKMVGSTAAKFEKASLQNLKLIECKTLSEEALTIAIILREALEDPEKTAVVITADQELDLRIRGELERWGIILPYSKILRTDTEGVLVNLIGAIVKDHFDPIDLLSFLKHPHVQFEGNIDKIETKIFRTMQRTWTWDLLKEEMRNLSASSSRKSSERIEEDYSGSISTPHHGSRINRSQNCSLIFRDDDGGDNDDGVKHLSEIISPLHTAQKDVLTLEKWTQKLKEVLRHCVLDFDEDPEFQKLSQFLNQIEASSSGFPKLTMRDYFEILNELMSGQSHQETTTNSERIQILGVLEARFIKRDLIILAGLNEGSWPPEIHEDPWLSRPMRAAMDFSSPERRIGLSAHDFGSAFSSPNIILTRSLRKGGTPTVPSRFLKRLEITLKSEGQDVPLDHHYTALASQLDTSQESLKMEAGAPCPPLAARPTQFYVTHVEMLRRDPYAYYAKNILKLKPLDPINYPPRASDRGSLFHKILERIFDSSINLLAEEAWEQIEEIARAEFDQLSLDSTTRLFWWNRFQRFGKWFLKTERTLRTEHPNLKTYVEMEGELTFKTLERNYTLKAKADRLDLYPDGRIAVIDYKTGVPPSAQDVELGFAPQLPLEAAIVQEGGFRALGVREAHSLAFWWLKGNADGGEIKEIKGEAPKLALQAFDGFCELLEFYEDPANGYCAEPLPEQALQYNDYEGVSRVKERRRG